MCAFDVFINVSTRAVARTRFVDSIVVAQAHDRDRVFTYMGESYACVRN